MATDAQLRQQVACPVDALIELGIGQSGVALLQSNGFRIDPDPLGKQIADGGLGGLLNQLVWCLVVVRHQSCLHCNRMCGVGVPPLRLKLYQRAPRFVSVGWLAELGDFFV